MSKHTTYPWERYCPNLWGNPSRVSFGEFAWDMIAEWRDFDALSDGQTCPCIRDFPIFPHHTFQLSLEAKGLMQSQG